MREEYDKLLQYAFYIISRKRYTAHEMRKKLKAYCSKHFGGDCGEELVNEVAGRMEELKYLDDEQFARDFVSERLRLRPRGKTIIRQELKFKGVERDLIESVFDEIYTDESEAAAAALEKRAGKLSKYPVPARKHKAYQFLLSKGFKRDAIYRAIESCYNGRL
ncbi:MAG: regulatory protein RecX [Candidatus Peregrinibacteria bacterium]